MVYTHRAMGVHRSHSAPYSGEEFEKNKLHKQNSLIVEKHHTSREYLPIPRQDSGYNSGTSSIFSSCTSLDVSIQAPMFESLPETSATETASNDGHAEVFRMGIGDLLIFESSSTWGQAMIKISAGDEPH